ncbi:MAG: hotdog fold thioesterase [Sphingomonadales bacterium]|nr:hotdog fold thioesterase [Sphingomonadales bacterium]
MHGTMSEALGMEIMHAEMGCITARMPVDHRTKQPFGLLHGGASVALAETLGSIGANMLAYPDKYAVGMEINANHLRPVSDGYVTGTAKVIHQGSSSHVWEIRIEDDRGNLCCISRFTAAIRRNP